MLEWITRKISQKNYIIPMKTRMFKIGVYIIGYPT